MTWEIWYMFASVVGFNLIIFSVFLYFFEKQLREKITVPI